MQYVGLFFVIVAAVSWLLGRHAPEVSPRGRQRVAVYQPVSAEVAAAIAAGFGVLLIIFNLD